MNNEISIRVGKKTAKMRFTKWPEGAALTSLDDMAPIVAEQSARVFAWNPRTGEIQRYHRVEGKKLVVADKS